LKETAAALRLISITQSLLWFLAGYAGIWASMLSWITVIGSVGAVIAAISGETEVLWLPVVGGAEVIISLLPVFPLTKAADRWGNLRGAPILFLIATRIFCFPGLLFLLIIYSPGLIGRSRLRKSINGRKDIAAGFKSIAEVLERNGSLEASSDEEKRREHR